MKPLGLMGGTFDPVHLGHLRLALDALEQLDLEAVRWIPSGQPGHRDSPRAGAAQRLEMLRLALAEEPRFGIDSAELDSPESTYTVFMLQRLRRELGDDRPLVMLIGMDSLLSFATWKDWRRLFDLSHFAVADRPGCAFDPDTLAPGLREEYQRRKADSAALASQPAGRIVHFPAVQMAISSSDIRDRLRRGDSARYMIPETLVRYIGSTGLYA